MTGWQKGRPAHGWDRTIKYAPSAALLALVSACGTSVDHDADLVTVLVAAAVFLLALAAMDIAYLKGRIEGMRWVSSLYDHRPAPPQVEASRGGEVA